MIKSTKIVIAKSGETRVYQDFSTKSDQNLLVHRKNPMKIRPICGKLVVSDDFWTTRREYNALRTILVWRTPYLQLLDPIFH